MQRNAQAPSKVVDNDGMYLAINSIFHTLQGEGPFSGQPAVFVRFAGCNLQCPMCDTEYTKQTREHVDDIVTAIGLAKVLDGGRVAPTHLVVITGGEPFRQNFVPLVQRLLHYGYIVQVETNGTLFRSGAPYDHKDFHIVCSPKTGRVHPALEPHICAFKYVARADNIRAQDGLPIDALEHPVSVRLARPANKFNGRIYLQPVDEQDPERNKENMEAVVNACLLHGHTLCLQTHKIVEVP